MCLEILTLLSKEQCPGSRGYSQRPGPARSECSAQGRTAQEHGVVTLAQVATLTCLVSPELQCPRGVNQKLFSAVEPLCTVTPQPN